MLDQDIVTLAKSIHGGLVPEAIYHGTISSANPHLHNTMPCLPGISYLEALGDDAELNSDDKAIHICYVQHLARQLTFYPLQLD